MGEKKYGTREEEGKGEAKWVGGKEGRGVKGKERDKRGGGKGNEGRGLGK